MDDSYPGQSAAQLLKEMAGTRGVGSSRERTASASNVLLHPRDLASCASKVRQRLDVKGFRAQKAQ
jgi:hypothetical protein